ncbi:hypothetical protein ACUQZ3_004318 [Enterobacter hormaechei]|nr:hypothetical protein [Enterobacter hormaechei]EKT9838037.1 hypothetical protein [Enterobacter hormaechei]ELD2090883.1 hypothetical protein [Enterobacter hormaechei]ELD3414547.1 hypothetical protein [Enterobacter hormaechei]
MTNVSAVEKMAELMQQMEENSPRVAAFQYCLKQVAEKVEEAEKRNAELQARCEALAAENALLKKSEPAPFSKLMMEALDVYQAGADEVPELAMLSAYKKLRDGLKTLATEVFLAEVRAQGVEMFGQWLRDSADIFDKNSRHDWAAQNRVSADKAGEFADHLRKGVQS